MDDSARTMNKASRKRTMPSKTIREVMDSNRLLRVLVIDDDNADRLIIKRALGKTGLQLEIVEAANGKEGLLKLQDQRFDCVLIDYMLPDMPGTQLLEAITAPEWPMIAAIMLTGAGDENVATHALTHGAQDYLTKNNLNVDTIRRALLRAVEKIDLLQDLEQQREALEQSNRELEQYAYVTSHDLQEPLRIIVSFLQLLERRNGDKLDAKSREYMSFIIDGSRRMQQMVASLLELSRIGRGNEDFQRCDIGELLQEAMANLKISIEESGARIDIEAMPVISCNRQRIVQLLQNLIGNAIKYRGDEAPRITVSAEPMAVDAIERLNYGTSARHQTIWKFCVEDNGIGIDPKYADRIFVIFQRLHARTAYEGTGIGLALCKKIVQRHHGRIWVEPREEGGSRFVFTLPSLQQ